MKFFEEEIKNSPFQDNLNLNGLVILEDKKSGSVLFKKHNMILKEAKRLLFSKLLQFENTSVSEGKIVVNKLNTFLNLTSTESILDTDKRLFTDKSLKGIILGYSESDVGYNDTFDKIKSFGKEQNDDEPFRYIYKELNVSNSEVSMSESHPDYFVFKISLDISYTDFNIGTNDEIIINTLGVVCGLTSGTEREEIYPTIDKLFSRIVFDPIIITQDSDLKLTYYIYF